MQSQRAPFVTVERRPLAQLVQDLRALGDLRARARIVDTRLDGFAVPVDAVVRSLRFVRGGYTRTLVWRDARFELLILAWSGGASPVHDHDGQDCWFVPLAGAFDLDDYAVLRGHGQAAHLTPLRTRRLQAGQLDHRDERQAVHAVTAATPLALSLHVYARPLARCRVYDLRRGTWSWRTLRYDAVVRELGE